MSFNYNLEKVGHNFLLQVQYYKNEIKEFRMFKAAQHVWLPASCPSRDERVHTSSRGGRVLLPFALRPCLGFFRLILSARISSPLLRRFLAFCAFDALLCRSPELLLSTNEFFFGDKVREGLTLVGAFP
jgi:hypothetical protein